MRPALGLSKVEPFSQSSDPQRGKAIVSGTKATHNHVLSVITQTYSVESIACLISWQHPWLDD
jgi:hypothetical protein